MAKVNKFIFWTPRILAIVFILFIAMFSLDIFDGNYGFWGTILGLFMHNIPTMILIILVVISWRHELAGAIIFILTGMLYITMLLRTVLMNQPHQWFKLFWSLIISCPAFLIGILFYLGWIKKKRIKRNKIK